MLQAHFVLFVFKNGSTISSPLCSFDNLHMMSKSLFINIASSYLSVFNIASSSSTSSILHHHQYCIILSQCYRNHFLGKAPTMIDNSICLQTFGSKGRFHLIEYDMRNILINNQFHYHQYDIWRIEFRFKNKTRISAKCEQNAIDICSRLAVAW